VNQKITLLIGHRGVGKTSLLKRLNSYCGKYKINADTVDLDSHIEQCENKKISDIFAGSGESVFRKLEKKFLKKIITNANKKTYIAIGAGFMGPYPDNAQIIFVKRESDKNGRTFLDRPRLNKELSAFDEYKDLYNKREQHYSGQAALTLVLQEGLKESNYYEELFFGFTGGSKVSGVYTLLSYEADNIDFYLNLGFEKIEVRTDYFDNELLESIIKKIPDEKLLLSVRDDKQLIEKPHMDWPLELGEPNKKYFIISSHNKIDGVEKSTSNLEKYSDRCDILKMAIPVNSFEELILGHRWYLKNPKKNCFLPISKDGRFSWYRLIQKNKIFPNFFKTTVEGSALDQPYFHDWVSHRFKNIKGFAAIMGLPVNHSWTPNEHQCFFAEFNMPVVKINLSEDELTKNNLNFLSSLGLKAAAVTSPLKNNVSNIINGENQNAVNTIVYTGTKWLTTNTDDHGFNKLAGHLKNKTNVVLWGGGGVITSVKKVLPEVSSYSARSGEPRSGELAIEQPEVLIWATGRSRHENWPNEAWAPKTIVDINYSEDSPGKEYALMVGAEYVSGTDMFVAQAYKQQEFWREHLK